MTLDHIAPVEDLIPRGVYRITSRNLAYGVWNPDTLGFIGIREKFGDKFLFTEYHYDTNGAFGTVRTAEYICMLPADILLAEDVCFYCHAPYVPDSTNDIVHGVSLGNVPNNKYIPFVPKGEPCPGRAGVTTYKPLFDYLTNIETHPLQSIIDESLGIKLNL